MGQHDLVREQVDRRRRERGRALHEGQRVRLVLEPRLAPPIVATRDRADDAVGAREERLERGDGDEPLAAREERSHVAVALGVDDDALAVLGVADALSGGERNGSAHYEILGWCRPT
jgi:hypothetical protein